MTRTSIKVGVIGYGLSAQVFHIPLILTTPTLHLTAILQRPSSNPSSPSAAADHPSVEVHTTLPSLLSSDCALIVITTPPQTHFALCSAALTAGKHVLVEKPFVPTSSEATELIGLAKTHKVLLCVYQNRRWDSDFLTFLALQKAGALGRIVEFESHFDRFRPGTKGGWKGELRMRDGGGILFDLGTHLIDQVVAAFGIPRSVSGAFVNQRKGAMYPAAKEGLGKEEEEEPDSITVSMYYENGMLATLKAGVMIALKDQLRFLVKGTSGSWVKYGMDVQEDQLRKGMKPGDDGFGVEAKESAGTLFRVKDAEKAVIESEVFENVEPLTYGKLFREFATAILNRDESMVPVKAEEARDVLRVIEAARESAETGKRVDL